MSENESMAPNKVKYHQCSQGNTILEFMKSYPLIIDGDPVCMVELWVCPDCRELFDFMQRVW